MGDGVDAIGNPSVGRAGPHAQGFVFKRPSVAGCAFFSGFSRVSIFLWFFQFFLKAVIDGVCNFLGVFLFLHSAVVISFLVLPEYFHRSGNAPLFAFDPEASVHFWRQMYTFPIFIPPPMRVTNVLALPALGRNEERMGCIGPCNCTHLRK